MSKWHCMGGILIALFCHVCAYGFGLADVSDKSPDNARFWEQSLIIIGVVEAVERLESPLLILKVAPSATLNGEFDPSARDIVHVAMLGEIWPISAPSKGDRVLIIMRPIEPGTSLADGLRIPAGTTFIVPRVEMRGPKTIKAVTSLGKLTQEDLDRVVAAVRDIRSVKRDVPDGMDRREQR
jgi:hypothetical protein